MVLSYVTSKNILIFTFKMIILSQDLFSLFWVVMQSIVILLDP